MHNHRLFANQNLSYLANKNYYVVSETLNNNGASFFDLTNGRFFQKVNWYVSVYSVENINCSQLVMK